MTGTIRHGDNLAIMRGMQDASVDMIYMDPPFYTQKDWGAFEDKWAGMVHYISRMREVCAEGRRLLRRTGSLFLHCDWRASHRLRVMLDAVFGMDRFVNEIAWCYREQGVGQRAMPRKHDSIYFYGKTEEYKFKHLKIKRYRTGKFGKNDNTMFYKDEFGMYCYVSNSDWWVIPKLSNTARERTGYPTQKPVELLKRIIEYATDPGDVVLDPFMGSGTACVAAKNLGRGWIGIDKSEEAVQVARNRLGQL